MRSGIRLPCLVCSAIIPLAMTTHIHAGLLTIRATTALRTEDEFYLATKTFAQLERNSPSPQAEQGIYFESRYELSRPILLVN